jgi:trk system potassium uptake protein TrkA
MRIVIVGASRFGISTASRLADAGHEVVIVDRDGDKLATLSEEIDAGLLEGDGSLPTVLREAYGDGADALVLLTNVDDVNILAALVGRSVGYPRVVPQIVREELMAVCEELGLENLITPHATVARSIARTLETQHDAAIDLMSHSGFDVLGYRVGADKAGTRIRDLDLPDATRLIAVAREEREELVTEEMRLEEGDTLIAAVAPDAQDEMDQLFPPGNGENDNG